MQVILCLWLRLWISHSKASVLWPVLWLQIGQHKEPISSTPSILPPAFGWIFIMVKSVTLSLLLWLIITRTAQLLYGVIIYLHVNPLQSHQRWISLFSFMSTQLRPARLTHKEAVVNVLCSALFRKWSYTYTHTHCCEPSQRCEDWVCYIDLVLLYLYQLLNWSNESILPYKTVY